MNSLEEGLLLGILLDLLGGIAAHREAVHDTRVEVNLVRMARLLQNTLGLVPHIGREDAVSLGRCNRKRASNGGELLLFHKGGVGEVADIDAILIMASNVL